MDVWAKIRLSKIRWVEAFDHLSFSKHAPLHSRLPEMFGELSTMSWDIILFNETRNALGTIQLESGHLFSGSLPLSLAAGIGTLLHTAACFQTETGETHILAIDVCWRDFFKNLDKTYLRICSSKWLPPWCFGHVLWWTTLLLGRCAEKAFQNCGWRWLQHTTECRSSWRDSAKQWLTPDPANTNDIQRWYPSRMRHGSGCSKVDVAPANILISSFATGTYILFRPMQHPI